MKYPFPIFIYYKRKLMADGLMAMISQEHHFPVIGLKEIEGKPMITDIHPHPSLKLLLLEIDWPQITTYVFLESFKQKHPHVKILLVSNLLDSPIICDLMGTGLDGFILKGCGKDKLMEAIHQISKGNTFYSTPVTTVLLRNLKKNGNENNHILTKREKQVLQLIIQLYSNSEIAKQLSISATTVKTHRQNIMKKLDAHNLIALIRYACRESFILPNKSGMCLNCPHKAEVNCHCI